MEKIQQNCIIPSAACSVPKRLLKFYRHMPAKVPEIGDVVYGEVSQLGFHKTLESASARIHTIHDRTKAVFIFGNRYAPDHYESLIPDNPVEEIEMVARSGIISEVKCTNELIASPTKIKILGYICNENGDVVNTRNHVLINPKNIIRKSKRAKIILCVGTTMNSGKSYAAAACCYALSSNNRKIRAAKITGTASLKDILLMQDCGAQHVADFTSFGYPSTYMLKITELLHIFHTIDQKYGNNPDNYLILEFADGVLQRETAMLLGHPDVQQRLHKLILCASDAAGIIGGLKILKESFNLTPDAISGLCSSSPLAIREISTLTDIPVVKSMEKNYKAICNIIQ